MLAVVASFGVSKNPKPSKPRQDYRGLGLVAALGEKGLDDTLNFNYSQQT